MELGISRLLPEMVAAGKGHVVIVSAVASHRTVPNLSSYITGKTAQRRIAEVAGLELKDTGVAVFSIDPGFVVTDLARETMTSADAAQHLPDMVRRLGEAQSRNFDAELNACARRVADLLSGNYDRLSGRYFEIPDDLDAELRALDARLEEERA